MLNSPKVSVIMPIYNGEKYLSETIESVLNQTFKDFEFIIINEYGSNNHVASILQKYEKKDQRIRVIQNSERLGLALSLNLGIETAKGEYIARVDGDDPSYPDRFEKQVNFLDSKPNVFLCGSLQRALTPNGLNFDEFPTNEDELRATLLFGCDISHSSVFMRRNTLIENGWRYSSESFCEDYDLWTRIIHNATFSNLPEVLVDHRWGFGQKSTSETSIEISGIASVALLKSAKQISERVLEEFGINIGSYNCDMVLGGFRFFPKQLGKENPETFLDENFQLFCEIEERNNQINMFDRMALHNVLARRWVKWVQPCVGDLWYKYPDGRFTDYQDITKNYMRSIPAFKPSLKVTASTFIETPSSITNSPPLISVVMTVYNSAKYIREAIDSIIVQTSKDWEFLIINEYGSNDGTAQIIKDYALRDPRIKLIQNTKRLGFAESLNQGIRMSKGKYIARMDADDISLKNRFELQSNFLENNPDIGHVGSWQKHFGRDNWIHKPLTTHDEIKAALLFRCDLCHSTVMFRRDVFVNNNLFYNPEMLAEDFELWTRAIVVTRFATIPRTLGLYRTGDSSLTDRKLSALFIESGVISAKSIERIMGFAINENDYYLLRGWKRQTFEDADLSKLKSILLKIWDVNNHLKQIEPSILLSQLYAIWRWCCYGENWKNRYSVDSIKKLINDDGRNSLSVRKIGLPSFRSFIKDSLKKTIRPFLRYIDSKKNDLYWDLDGKIWHTEKSLIRNNEWNRNWIIDSNVELKNLITTLYSNVPYIPFIPGEKIRIVFIYEIPSFWPSWDTVIMALKDNPDVELKIVLFDVPMTEPLQIRGAEDLLIEKEIPYIRFDELDIDSYRPHIVFYQTPYDEYHHPLYLQAPCLRAKGCRIVYITYGIEITKTNLSVFDHFKRQVVLNAWRVYTVSPSMRQEYLKYISSMSVKSLGHPKFDRLYDKSIPKNKKLLDLANGRKILLLKLHWTKQDGDTIYTPNLNVYVDFMKYIPAFDDIFFAIMPHPNFFDSSRNEKSNNRHLVEQIREIANNISNVMLCMESDYRSTLICSNFFISDRSAVMIEASVLDIPILYMTGNAWEPLNDAINPIVMSYYIGQTCEDMLRFLEMCRNGQDPKRSERVSTVSEWLPSFDGKSGERISKDLIEGVKNTNY